MPCVFKTGRSRKPFLLLVGLLLVGGVTADAAGQSLADRIAHVRRERAREAAAEKAAEAARLWELNRRLGTRMDLVLDGAPTREALRRWSRRAGVPLVVNWDAMENDGVDVERALTLELRGIPAQGVLLRLMDQMSDDERFVAELHPWGLTLQTRTRANRRVVAEVYDVRDLLVRVPQFTNAPSFDLRDALSNTSSGGGGSGSGGGGGLFGDEDREQGTPELTRAEREEQLAQLIRDVIEPDLWQANGGEHSRLKIRNGLLIVRAPRYVHQQIGRPVFRAGE